MLTTPNTIHIKPKNNWSHLALWKDSFRGASPELTVSPATSGRLDLGEATWRCRPGRACVRCHQFNVPGARDSEWKGGGPTLPVMRVEGCRTVTKPPQHSGRRCWCQLVAAAALPACTDFSFHQHSSFTLSPMVSPEYSRRRQTC